MQRIRNKPIFLPLLLVCILVLSGISRAWGEEQVAVQVKNPGASSAFDPFFGEPEDPFAELLTMRSRVNQMFEDSFRHPFFSAPTRSGWNSSFDAPTLDVAEAADEFLVTCNLPGIGKENIEVNIEDRVLTISGKHEQKTQDEKEESGYRYHHRESSYGAFQRSIKLPDTVDEKNVRAEYKDGQLIIHLGKLKNTEAKRSVNVPIQ